MSEKPSRPLAKLLLYGFGLFVVLYGAADLLSRVGYTTLGSNSNITAFGPAIVALDSSAASSLSFAATAKPLSPARLVVPSVGIDATVEQVGTKADGSMATPSSFSTVGWYKDGPWPGAPGNAVIAGHVNNALTKAGVFEHLDALALGDTITVIDAQGRELHYAVNDIEDYRSTEAPVGKIFATNGPTQLVLITCAGDWDPRAHSYDHRLVITAGLLAQ